MHSGADPVTAAIKQGTWDSIQKINAKLKRVIRYLAYSRITPGGRLDPTDQRAVRLIESRQRLLEREWYARFGNDVQRERARIELQVDRDRGDLIHLAGRNHGVGRLDCRACDVEVEPAAGELGVGRLVSKARLCGYCHKGILHVYSVAEDLGPSPSTGEGALMPLRGDLPGKNVIIRTFHECDGCRKWTQEVE